MMGVHEGVCAAGLGAISEAVCAALDVIVALAAAIGVALANAEAG